MKKIVPSSFLIGSLGLLWASCAASFMDVNKLQSDLGITKPIVQEQYPEADAVIIMESHDIELSFDNNFNLSTYEDVRVLKKVFKNFDEHANVEIFVQSGDKLSNLEARTIMLFEQLGREERDRMCTKIR